MRGAFYVDFLEGRMRKNHLKLFIWADFNPDRRLGLAFAIAKDETDTKSLIEDELGFEVFKCDWGDLEIRPLTKRTAKCVI